MSQYANLKKGNISLYSKDGEILRSSSYHWPNKRNEIIEKWKELYAKRFNECYIQIQPMANEKSVDENTGMNLKFKRDKRTTNPPTQK